jgi:hypothetical protein
LLDDDPSCLGQRDRRGHAWVGDFQHGTGRQAIDITVYEYFGIPSQKGHEHLFE